MKTFKDWLTLGLGLGLAALVTFDVVSSLPHAGPSPRPAAVVDGVRLGKAYAPQVLSTLADAWDAAADAVARGRSMAEAQAVLQQSWQSARARAFAASVAPEFSRVLAEATEPADAAQRARVVALWRQFAQGVKGGR